MFTVFTVPSRHTMRRVLVGSLLVGSLSLSGSHVGADEVPTTVPAAGDAVALLTDVTLATDGFTDRVVFTFADDALPASTLSFGEPPFLDIPGEDISVTGAAFVEVAMSGASGDDLGWRCSEIPAVTPGAGEVLVAVYRTCASPTPGPYPVVPTHRAVPDGEVAAQVTAAVEALLAGPSAAEEAGGVSSPFSSGSAGLLSSLTVGADGTAVLDLDPTIVAEVPSGGEGGEEVTAAQVMRELGATVVLHEGVESAELRLGGSCDAFWDWLGLGECQVLEERDGTAFLHAPTYTGPDRVPGVGSVTEVVQQSDFEAQLNWVMGLSTTATVEVSTAENPTRLILEVTPVPPAPPAVPTPATPRLTG